MLSVEDTVARVPEFVGLDQASFRLGLSDPSRSVSQTELRISQSPDTSVVALAGRSLGSAVPSVESVLDEMVGPTQRDVRRFPQSARAHFNLGLSLLNAGQTEQAVAALGRAHELEPHEAKIAYQFARALISIGRRDEARLLLTALLQESPSDWSLVCGLADCALGDADYTKAIELWTTVIQLRPQWPDGHYYRGIALLLAGSARRNLAIKDLRIASRLDPRRPAFYQGLGVGYAVAGDFQRAERTLRIALRLKPAFSEALEALTTVLLQAHRLEDASTILDARLKEEPTNLRLLELAAWAYVTRGRPADAKAYLHRAFGVLQKVGGEPDDVARVANNLGVCSARSRDWNEAARLYSRALQVSPDYSPIAYQNLAQVLVETGEVEGAVDALRDCVRRFPESEGARIGLSALLSEQGNEAEGLSILRDWIQGANAGAPAYASYGAQMADRCADYAGAIRVIREGLDRYPGDSLLLNNLAYVQLMDGRIIDARSTLESSASAMPNKSIYLRATWGLLSIREGKIEDGIDAYRKAADEAKGQGEDRVASDVLLKMHLELARAYLSAQRIQEAAREIELGRAIKGRSDFKRDLDVLAARVSPGKP